MSQEIMLIPTMIFWLLAIACICAPLRYGVLLLILLVQVDLTGIAFYSDTSLGWGNTVKIVIIPTILLLRMRPLDLLPSAFRFARNSWLFFISYAALAIIWSPYRLSGLKLMGYFYAYSVLFVVFACAWRRHWFERKSLIILVWISLLFAVIQTYLMGNPYGDPEYDNRFTTFADAQSFAPFLICMIILLVLCNRRTWSGLVAAGAALLGLILTGSRSSLIGFFWVALVIGVAFAKQANKHLSLTTLIRNTLIGCLLFVLLGILVLESLPRSRLTELVDVVTSFDRNSLETVGTFAWRLTVYTQAIDEISARGLRELMLGSGTSSGATVGLQTGFYQEMNVDPNRVVHDEFLRALYEWGVVGLVTFICFVTAMFGLCFKLVKLTSSPYAWASLAVFGPLLIGLLVENILADGASPGGVGYCLVFASMIGQLRPAPAKVPAHQPALRSREAIG